MNSHILSVLDILHTNALRCEDPKPALRDPQLPPEVALLTLKLADEIESHFSQAEALRYCHFGFTTEEIDTLKSQEDNGNLAYGYSTLLRQYKEASQASDTQAKGETPKGFSFEDVQTLWNKLSSQETQEKIQEALRKMAESSTNQAWKKACTEVLQAMEKDGKSLKEAISQSEAFGTVFSHTSKVREKAQAWLAQARAKSASLRETYESHKHKVNWKVVGAAIGGICLATLLTRKK